MKKLRRFVPKTTVVAACAALVCYTILSGSLHAAGADTFIVPIVNVTFNPSTCSSLTPTQVTLNGQYHFVVHTSQNPDDTYTTEIRSEAHGTATDNSGGQYVFSYINHEQDLSSSPTDAPPILGVFTDRFGLNSKGNAPNVRVQFQLVFSVDAQGNFTPISEAVFKGDPNCDPI